MKTQARDKKIHWDKRAFQYAYSRGGYKAICSYGAPYIYNKYIDLIQKKAFMRMLKSVELEGRKVLDAGCGIGRWCRLLSGKGAMVTGADISEEMIKHAKKTSAFHKIDYVNAPISALDYPSSNFDLITCVTVLQHITDDEEFKRSVVNLVRMLSKGGRLFIMEAAPSMAPSDTSFNDYFLTRMEDDYIKAFEEAGAPLKDIFSVDVVPLKQKLILRSKRMSRTIYYLLLNISAIVSLPVDYFVSGTSSLRRHSWHKAFIFYKT